MQLLLDTQAAYLWTVNSSALPESARTAIEDVRNRVTLSAASFWEISIKRAKGKLDWPEDGFEQLLQSRFIKLAVTPQHGVAAGALPSHHADPFDRVLIAQAQIEGLTLVGADPAFGLYEVDTLWD
ncbi:MAG: type II toxin-antitoxin system VapC family toxin [Solirubrobacterales bacterium]|nr:type II toxin-antitoxin system VapC family toxin [Solirubrobacterales bacterium]